MNQNRGLGILKTVTYANDDVINYYYDSSKNLISEKRNDNNAAYVTYSYNSDNELTEKVNYDTGLRYTYGDNDSVTVTKLSDNTVVQTYTQSSNEDSVDSEDAVVTTINESHFGTSYSSQVANRSTTFTAGSNSVNYTFTNNSSNNIATEAVSYNNAQAFSTSYSYDSKENITSKVITLADNTTFNVVNTYDSKNRITSTGYGSAEQSYTYDQYGQLTQTVDTANGFTENYSYDQRGNILSNTKVYDDTSLPAETTTFSYGNSAWPDELTSVNGTSLTYDANGNVLTYGNMEFQWFDGRLLHGININNLYDGGINAQFEYNENGVRIEKTVNGKTTHYNIVDDIIISQTDGTNTMFFQYDKNNSPIGLVFNNTQYFYLTNQMGDIIAITDATGSVIVKYYYDAWGNTLSLQLEADISTEAALVASCNPLRYRGYYLDIETGLYYLKSRYYYPQISRFINADMLVIQPEEKLCTAGENMFVYCCNEPISRMDRLGTLSMSAVKKKYNPIALMVRRFLLKYDLSKLTTTRTIFKVNNRGATLYLGVSASLSWGGLWGSVTALYKNGTIRINKYCSMSVGRKIRAFQISSFSNGYNVKCAYSIGSYATAFSMSIIYTMKQTKAVQVSMSVDIGLRIAYWLAVAITVVVAGLCFVRPYLTIPVRQIFTAVRAIKNYSTFSRRIGSFVGAGLRVARCFA